MLSQCTHIIQGCRQARPLLLLARGSFVAEGRLGVGLGQCKSGWPEMEIMARISYVSQKSKTNLSFHKNLKLGDRLLPGKSRVRSTRNRLPPCVRSTQKWVSLCVRSTQKMGLLCVRSTQKMKGNRHSKPLIGVSISRALRERAARYARACYARRRYAPRCYAPALDNASTTMSRWPFSIDGRVNPRTAVSCCSASLLSEVYATKNVPT